MSHWATTLFDRRVSPIQVAVMSAAEWVNEPFSPSQFVAMNDGDLATLTNVSYHMRKLESYGLLEVVEVKHVRGAAEILYGLAG
jgi:hypothetical protein